MQLSICDICKEPIQYGSNKCLLAMNVSPEANRTVKEEEYKELILSVFTEMQNPNKTIPLYEICGGCLKVLYGFINIRKEELDKARTEMKKIYIKKTKTAKETK